MVKSEVQVTQSCLTLCDPMTLMEQQGGRKSIKNYISGVPCMPLKEFITIIYVNPIPSGETGHPACEAFRND